MCPSCPGLASQVARFLANLARTAMLRTAFVAQVGGEAARHEHSSQVLLCASCAWQQKEERAMIVLDAWICFL